MDFRDLDKGFAAIDRHFGIGEAGRNRGGGTGVSRRTNTPGVKRISALPVWVVSV
jgi:hypothetical protein